MSDTIASPEIVIGVDVGGTFIDIVAIEKEGGVVRAEKVLSTPSDLSVGIIEGLEKMFGPQLGDIIPASRIVHATTSATNALLENSTSRVGLITNRGFRDVLEIRRHARTDTYNIGLEIAPPLVPRDLRVEIDGRLAPDGTVLKSIDRQQVAAVVRTLMLADVEVYVVCLLHAYARPEEEHAVAEIIRVGHADHRVAIAVRGRAVDQIDHAVFHAVDGEAENDMGDERGCLIHLGPVAYGVSSAISRSRMRDACSTPASALMSIMVKSSGALSMLCCCRSMMSTSSKNAVPVAFFRNVVRSSSSRLKLRAWCQK